MRDAPWLLPRHTEPKSVERAGKSTSAIAGTVQQLAVNTIGGVVTPAQALLVVVPAESRIEIEAMIQNRDIGFVEAGQDAEVKIDTFNFTATGSCAAKS